MPAQVTLPVGVTPGVTPTTPLDASAAGIVLPIFSTSPLDSMWAVPPPNGTMVIEAGTGDTTGLVWVRIGGVWSILGTSQ